MNAIKTVLLVAGLMFLLVGLAIAISENQNYATQLNPLYILVMYSLYGFLGFIMVALLLASFDFLRGSLGHKL